jgi:hypothetical protein
VGTIMPAKLAPKQESNVVISWPARSLPWNGTNGRQQDAVQMGRQVMATFLTATVHVLMHRALSQVSAQYFQRMPLSNGNSNISNLGPIPPPPKSRSNIRSTDHGPFFVKV